DAGGVAEGLGEAARDRVRRLPGRLLDEGGDGLRRGGAGCGGRLRRGDGGESQPQRGEGDGCGAREGEGAVRGSEGRNRAPRVASPQGVLVLSLRGRATHPAGTAG